MTSETSPKLTKVKSSDSLPSIEDNLTKYTFSPEELKETYSVWKKEGWPLKLLQRDHYSAKILQDNGIFKSIKLYGHTWKWDEDEGLIILYKKDKTAPATWTKWADIANNLNIKKTPRGDFMLEGACYGKEGFEYEKYNFQFSPSEFKWMLNKFHIEGWPVQFLLRDHYGAKVMFDNQVFFYTDLYGHGWKWDDEKGLFILFKRTLHSKAEFTAWDDIKHLIPICRTAQGWLLFDGWNYLPDGLVPIHLWQWKELTPSYVFPSNRRPNYSYVDFVTLNWEHEGMPGVGFDSTPTGHTSIEFGDDQGNFYSLGYYMDPRSLIDMKKTPAALLRGVLMSPDPYLPSKGEKTLHRYHLGGGKQGRKKIQKLKQHIEEIQGYQVNLETNIVSTMRCRKYHTFHYNCCDFQKEIEEYVRTELGGTLYKPPGNTIYLPRRSTIQREKFGWRETFHRLWNTFVLFILDIFIVVVTSLPWISAKVGVGQEDDFSDRTEDEVYFPGIDPKKKKSLRAWLESLKPRSVSFPRRHRVEQLFSPRLKNYTVTLHT
jgi:hypothetical protein